MIFCTVTDDLKQLPIISLGIHIQNKNKIVNERFLEKNGILHIAPKVVDTFLGRILKNGTCFQKVSTGK